MIETALEIKIPANLLQFCLRQFDQALNVNVSSLAGLVGLYSYSAYSMSKYAVRGLSEALQSELADDRREAAHARFTRAASLSADEAARSILRAVRKGKRRLILGIDARPVYTIHRLFPRSSPKIIQAIFGPASAGPAMFGGEKRR